MLTTKLLLKPLLIAGAAVFTVLAAPIAVDYLVDQDSTVISQAMAEEGGGPPAGKGGRPEGKGGRPEGRAGPVKMPRVLQSEKAITGAPTTLGRPRPRAAAARLAASRRGPARSSSTSGV